MFDTPNITWKFWEEFAFRNFENKIAVKMQIIQSGSTIVRFMEEKFSSNVGFLLISGQSVMLIALEYNAT